MSQLITEKTVLNIYSKHMNSPTKNLNHKITQSLSQYDQSIEQQDDISPLEENYFFLIDLEQDTTDNTQLSKETRKYNCSTKRRNKRTQSYLKTKVNKQDNRKSSQIQHQRYFSAVNRKSQLNISNQEINKNLQTQIQRLKNTRIVEIAMRYGMYNEKPRNYLSVKKKTKNTWHNLKNYQQQSLAQNQSVLLPQKISLSKEPQQEIDNKVSLGTLNIDMNQDKTSSLMLDRKNITRTVKEHSSQNINTDLGILERNKFMAQTSSTKNNKSHKKIQFFIQQNFGIDLESIKAKITNKLNDTNHKTQSLKIKHIKANKMIQKQSKNVSQQIHVPLKIDSKKHSSFTAFKNTNQKYSNAEFSLKNNPDKTGIIPASITFKKDKTNNMNLIDKITKSIQIEDQRKMYFQLQSRNFDQKIKQIPNQKPLPNLSTVQRPKTHKESRLQKDVNILRKSRREMFSVKPSEFTFVFDSKDHTYILDYLVSNGWSQFYSTKLSNIYTLKWVNNPVTSQILNMKEGQFYNHFHKSFQLTSKSFLNTNLKANRHFLQTHEFFPETYDIGNQAEREQFIENYKYNVMMQLLEKIIVYCFKSHKDNGFIKNSIDDILLLNEEEDYLKRTEEETKTQNQYFNAMEFENYKQPDKGFRLNIFLVTLSLKYYQRQRRRYDMDFKQNRHNFLKFHKHEFDRNYDMLELYSQQEDLGEPATEKGLYSYHYATPSELLLKLLIKEYCYLSRINRWKHPIESDKRNATNIWIVKPASNARGNGIYLQKNMGSMLKSAKDIQSRIVQKYIHQPLLFTKSKYSHLNNHKFDLRQWVLLKSLDPLEIYMFSHFYLRLASEKYQTKDIENNKVHLTNFSANKEFFKSNQNSIINSDEFYTFLKEEHAVDWEAELKPKVQEIIVKSIQACQEKLETPVNGTCFELLGYDILIDQNFTPWLIEVNMSPACEERTDWLSQYLKNMNVGLLELVVPESYFSTKPKKEVRKQNWQKIHHEEYHFVGKDYDPKLQVVSKQYIQKQRQQRQVQDNKSKSSLSNSMSPTKFKRKSTHQTLARGESAHKLRKYSFSNLNGVNISRREDQMNLTKVNANTNSFVVEDFVEETLGQMEEMNQTDGLCQKEEINQSLELDEVANEIDSKQQMQSSPYIQELDYFS